MKSSISLVTGGFDPLHKGHLEYINEAKTYSDYLIVGVNSDKWLENKKKLFLLPWEERAAVVENLKAVDEVIAFDDSDGTAVDAIYKCLEIAEKVIFANGGDRKKTNIPEYQKFQNDNRVEFIYSTGGSDKLNSSSWLIEDFTKKYLSNFGLENIVSIDAPWGSHTSYIDEDQYKVKQLFVDPGGVLSLQKHKHRLEHWVVGLGEATVELDGKEFTLKSGEYIEIPLQSIHRLRNKSKNPLVVVEVQCGDILEESDIIRLEDSYGRET